MAEGLVSVRRDAYDTASMPPSPSLADAAPARPAIDKLAFRRALGSFVTGVTIVTTIDRNGRPAGLTANSFNSVSLEPPMVLWSLALDSTSLTAFREAEWWAVHVLAAGQEHLSNQFARRDVEKFDGVSTTRGPGGIPLLDGSAARFICRAAFEYEGGDHAIFLGEVHDFEQAGHTPLVYHAGRYGGVYPLALAAADEGAEALGELQRQGHVDHQNGTPVLTESGRRLVEGVVGLASARGLSSHEVDAVRHLLGKL